MAISSWLRDSRAELDLVAVEDIMPISARLIVNPGALKLKRDIAKPLIDALSEVAANAA